LIGPPLLSSGAAPIRVEVQVVGSAETLTEHDHQHGESDSEFAP
jgi:hypothetical protein